MNLEDIDQDIGVDTKLWIDEEGLMRILLPIWRINRR